jgi:hypothetical protein
MSQWTQETTLEVLKKIYEKAATDRTYRELCLSQPEAAVKQVTDRPLPGGFTVRFIESTADATFVLPDFIGDSELSDEQLEAVVGGKKKKKKNDKNDDDIGAEYIDDDFPSFNSYTFFICGK